MAPRGYASSLIVLANNLARVPGLASLALAPIQPEYEVADLRVEVERELLADHEPLIDARHSRLLGVVARAPVAAHAIFTEEIVQGCGLQAARVELRAQPPADGPRVVTPTPIHGAGDIALALWEASPVDPQQLIANLKASQAHR